MLGDGWVYVNDNGQSTASVVEGKAVIDITNPVAGIWEQKLFHEPIQLAANKVYKLSYTIHATEEIRYEYIARTKSQQTGGRDENYIWSGPTLPKNETELYTHLSQPMQQISMILICSSKSVDKPYQR